MNAREENAYNLGQKNALMRHSIAMAQEAGYTPQFRAISVLNEVDFHVRELVRILELGDELDPNLHIADQMRRVVTEVIRLKEDK